MDFRLLKREYKIFLRVLAIREVNINAELIMVTQYANEQNMNCLAERQRIFSTQLYSEI